jgi:hypothetical protein
MEQILGWSRSFTVRNHLLIDPPGIQTNPDRSILLPYDRHGASKRGRFSLNYTQLEHLLDDFFNLWAETKSNGVRPLDERGGVVHLDDVHIFVCSAGQPIERCLMRNQDIKQLGLLGRAQQRNGVDLFSKDLHRSDGSRQIQS